MTDYHHISSLLLKMFRDNISVEEQLQLNDWIESSGIHYSFFESLFEHVSAESLVADLQGKLNAPRLS